MFNLHSLLFCDCNLGKERVEQEDEVVVAATTEARRRGEQERNIGKERETTRSSFIHLATA